MEGTYKRYKSVECVMSGVHDYLCYLKRGFGRSTWQAAVDIRNGILSRDEAFNLIDHFDTEKPGALEYFLKTTGMSENDLIGIMRKKKHKLLKSIKLKIKINKKKKKEDFLPFYEKLIKKHLRS